MLDRARLSLALIAACSPSAAPTPAPTPRARPAPAAATIHWTEHHVPHIVAPDLETLALGQGYAMARLHLCVFEDQMVRVRGERAAFFGPGPGDAYINSDFGVRALGYRETAEKLMSQASAETRAVLSGFAAGINRFVARAGEHPAPCKGEPWVQPVSALDVATYGLYLNSLGASGQLIDAVGAAVRPGARSTMTAPQVIGVPASNGWAIGGERTEGGGAILAGNPHFPWEGPNRFYESHLIIPGELNAYGAALIGSPLINLGFGKSAGWTHTFSASRRIAIYRLTMSDGAPLHYQFAGKPRALEAKTIRIEVLRDGQRVPLERVLYRSHHGPLVVTAATPWTDQHAYALADATWGRLGAIDQYLAMMRASSVAEIGAAIAKYQGSAFVNTIAADATGAAYYADSSLVPDLSATALAAYGIARKTVGVVEQAWQRGVIGLDGGRALFDFPGPVPFDRAPRLLRRDFVMNANNPYRTTNPAEPLSGYSILFGDTGAALSPRARMNLRLLGERMTWTARQVREALTSNRGFVEEEQRARVVAACKKVARLAAPCGVLERWDGRLDLDSVGAVLWRELLPIGSSAAPDFDAALGRLEEAGVAIDASVGSVQFFEKGGVRFPVPGGGSDEGTTNLAHYNPWTTSLIPGMVAGRVINQRTGLTTRGYPINYGTSFLFIAHFRPGLDPEAEGILVYGNSSAPDDVGQLGLWAKKKLRPLRFRLEDVEADPSDRVEVIRAE